MFLPPEHHATPKTGLDGLIENWRSDLLAGFLVFLLGLPLSLGIAIASGFPASAGIISALVGGLLVSRINGSFVTINGPAVGLIVVIYTAVHNLGAGDLLAGYRYTLAAIVIAGIIQICVGHFRVGQYSAYFPTSVVHGLLAAIGIIIIVKQTHVLLGVELHSISLFGNIAEIPYSFSHAVPAIAFIGFSGLAILLIWPTLKHPWLKKCPASIIVLVTGMLLGWLFGLHDASQSQFLVSVPDHIFNSFVFPDFSKLFTLHFLEAVISIFLIGSLETILSASAIDKLDPYRRKSDLDRDLSAVGAGNLLSGLIGGLPIITEIVRSSANIDSGAKTAWANFFHGLILLVFIVLFPRLIDAIPLSSLAVLLIFTGCHLCSLKIFKQVSEVGLEQLCIFVITIIGVLATDLLWGVALGILATLIIHILRGVWVNNLFTIYYEIHRPNHHTVVIKLLGSALFCNYLPLQQALIEIEPGKTLLFNFSNGYLIDHSALEFIDYFSSEYQAQGGQCIQRGLALKTFSDHKLAERLMTMDDRNKRQL